MILHHAASYRYQINDCCFWWGQFTAKYFDVVLKRRYTTQSMISLVLILYLGDYIVYCNLF